MKIKSITAPEYKYFAPNVLKIFLGGGIQKCIEWQNMIINYFKNGNYESDVYKDTYLVNPRRADWLDEPGAADTQVEWEYDMLERCDIFTMYFAGGESDQPICMYELGRNIERMKTKFPDDWWKRIVITCDSSYRRVFDVKKQTNLATCGMVNVSVVDGDKTSINEHADNIRLAILDILLEKR